MRSASLLRDPEVLTLTTFVGTFCLDVFSKWMVSALMDGSARPLEIAPFFNIVLTFNTGVTFGLFNTLLAKHQLLFALTSGCLAALLLFLSYAAPRLSDRLGLALIAGGGAGNALDRAASGRVTDFLDLHLYGRHWPTFNFADVAISIGVCLLLAGFLPIPHHQK